MEIDMDGRVSDYTEDFEEDMGSQVPLEAEVVKAVVPSSPKEKSLEKRRVRESVSKKVKVASVMATPRYPLGRTGGMETRNRGSTKQVYLPKLPSQKNLIGKTPSTTGVAPRDRVLSAKKNETKVIANKLADTKRQLEELKKENRTLKLVQTRQERDLKKLSKQEGELPQLLNSHGQEVRVLKEQLRRSQEQYNTSQRKINEMSLELVKVNDQKKKLQEVSRRHNLMERDMLTSQLKQTNESLSEKDKKISELERAVDLLNKTHREEVRSILQRNKASTGEAEELRRAANRMQIQLKNKDRDIERLNIYSQRVIQSMKAEEAVSKGPHEPHVIVKERYIQNFISPGDVQKKPQYQAQDRRRPVSRGPTITKTPQAYAKKSAGKYPRYGPKSIVAKADQALEFDDEFPLEYLCANCQKTVLKESKAFQTDLSYSPRKFISLKVKAMETATVESQTKISDAASPGRKPDSTSGDGLAEAAAVTICVVDSNNAVPKEEENVSMTASSPTFSSGDKFKEATPETESARKETPAKEEVMKSGTEVTKSGTEYGTEMKKSGMEYGTEMTKSGTEYGTEMTKSGMELETRSSKELDKKQKDILLAKLKSIDANRGPPCSVPFSSIPGKSTGDKVAAPSALEKIVAETPKVAEQGSKVSVSSSNKSLTGQKKEASQQKGADKNMLMQSSLTDLKKEDLLAKETSNTSLQQRADGVVKNFSLTEVKNKETSLAKDTSNTSLTDVKKEPSKSSLQQASSKNGLAKNTSLTEVKKKELLAKLMGTTEPSNDNSTIVTSTPAESASKTTDTFGKLDAIFGDTTATSTTISASGLTVKKSGTTTRPSRSPSPLISHQRSKVQNMHMGKPALSTTKDLFGSRLSARISGRSQQKKSVDAMYVDPTLVDKSKDLSTADTRTTGVNPTSALAHHSAGLISKEATSATTKEFPWDKPTSAAPVSGATSSKETAAVTDPTVTTTRSTSGSKEFPWDKPTTDAPRQLGATSSKEAVVTTSVTTSGSKEFPWDKPASSSNKTAFSSSDSLPKHAKAVARVPGTTPGEDELEEIAI